MTYFKDIDSLMSYLDDQSKKQDVNCPYCEYVYNSDDLEYYISYWGEEGPQETICPRCDKRFYIEEIVTRTYEVSKEIEND